MNRRQLITTAAAAVVAAGLAAYSSNSNGDLLHRINGPGSTEASEGAPDDTPNQAKGQEHAANTAEGLRDPTVLHRAEQIISTFENSTTDIQYDYVENLGDGRGVTAGRSGFTSGTGDLLQVVEEYAKLGNENSPLAAFIPALKKVNGTDSVAGLDGFVDAWKAAIKKDDTLKQAQDTVYKKLYLDPALKWSDKAKISTALGQTIILDTIIQQGEGDDVDGLPHVVKEVTSSNGTADGKEPAWLKAFLDVRQHHLEHAADPETRDAWRESVDRVKALRSLLQSGNMSLTPPIKWEVYGDTFSIKK